MTFGPVPDSRCYLVRSRIAHAKKSAEQCFRRRRRLLESVCSRCVHVRQTPLVGRRRISSSRLRPESATLCLVRDGLGEAAHHQGAASRTRVLPDVAPGVPSPTRCGRLSPVRTRLPDGGLATSYGARVPSARGGTARTARYLSRSAQMGRCRRRRNSAMSYRPRRECCDAPASTKLNGLVITGMSGRGCLSWHPGGDALRDARTVFPTTAETSVGLAAWPPWRRSGRPQGTLGSAGELQAQTSAGSGASSHQFGSSSCTWSGISTGWVQRHTAVAPLSG